MDNTRRSFLKKSLLGVAALATASVVKADNAVSQVTGIAPEPNPASAPMSHKTPLKVSIFSYSFFGGEFMGGRMDAFGFLESCKYRYGLDAADFCNCSFPHHDVDLEWVKKLKVGIDERELYVPGVAADWAQLLPNPGQTIEGQEKLQDKYLQVAKILGLGFLRFDTNGHSETALRDKDGRYIWTEKEFDYLVKRYRKMAQFAYDNGFKAGAENHMCAAREWKNIEKLCKAVDHPGFAICNHVGGWNGSPEEVAFADKASVPYTAHTHFAWNICEGPVVEKVKNLWDGGYDGYYSVEQHSGQNELNLVGVQLDKVKSVLYSLSKGGDGTLYK